MVKLYRYRKITDRYTTHCLVEPDYNQPEADRRITELCTIGFWTYVSVPLETSLPAQPSQVAATLSEIQPSTELLLQIKAASPHVDLINNRVVAKIRSVYDINEEIKMLRLAPSPESAAYNDYVEECREWGRAEKEKLGL